MILGSIAAVGGIAAASSSNGSVQVAGFGAMTGALISGAAVDVKNAKLKANSGEKGLNQTVYVPQKHVFTPFQVPPESYVKRWVVVQKPKDYDSYQSENFSFLTEVIQSKSTVVYNTPLK